MSLQQRLSDDVKHAMKAGEKGKLLVLRSTLAALKKESIDSGRELSEAEEIAILQRAIKQRRESVEAFTKGNRPELAQTENDEAEILSAYLPRQLSDAELGDAVAEAIRDTGAAGAKDMGKVMGRLLAKYKGHVDGGRAKEAVQKALSTS